MNASLRVSISCTLKISSRRFVTCDDCVPVKLLQLIGLWLFVECHDHILSYAVDDFIIQVLRITGFAHPQRYLDTVDSLGQSQFPSGNETRDRSSVSGVLLTIVVNRFAQKTRN